jgi:hypothetical protein
MQNDNPFQSPSTDRPDRKNVANASQPTSLAGAALAGIRFAIKWVTIILVPILVLILIGFLGLTVYRAAMLGDLSLIFESERRREVVRFFRISIGTYLVCCLWISIFAATAYSIRYLLTKKEENQP